MSRNRLDLRTGNTREPHQPERKHKNRQYNQNRTPCGREAKVHECPPGQNTNHARNNIKCIQIVTVADPSHFHGKSHTLSAARVDPCRPHNKQEGLHAMIGAMAADGVIETRPGDDDPAAVALMHKLAQKSRDRWPDWAQPAAKVTVSTETAG